MCVCVAELTRFATHTHMQLMSICCSATYCVHVCVCCRADSICYLLCACVCVLQSWVDVCVCGRDDLMCTTLLHTHTHTHTHMHTLGSSWLLLPSWLYTISAELSSRSEIICCKNCKYETFQWCNMWDVAVVQHVRHCSGATCETLQWCNMCNIAVVQFVRHCSGAICQTLQCCSMWDVAVVQYVRHCSGATCETLQWCNMCNIAVVQFVRHCSGAICQTLQCCSMSDVAVVQYVRHCSGAKTWDNYEAFENFCSACYMNIEIQKYTHIRRTCLATESTVQNRMSIESQHSRIRKSQLAM